MFICQPGYRFTLFFWLDFLSTVTLILDISWIYDAIFEGNLSSSSAAEIASAASAARIASRAGRVVRIVRLIRVFKMMVF